MTLPDKLPKRSPAHRTDTKAVRTVFTQLDEDWLMRGMDDYGIDLQLERFDGESATGDFIFAQVKGTQDSFNGQEQIKLNGFPVKTINYALMFNVPFFVFYTSVTDGVTKFVWLQKYAATKLERSTEDWKDQLDVTLYFPDKNDLSRNTAKITKIVAQEKWKREGVMFLSSLSALLHYSDAVLIQDETLQAHFCYLAAKKISAMPPFLVEFGVRRFTPDAVDAANYLRDAFQGAFSNGAITRGERAQIIEALTSLRSVRDNL